MSQTPGSDDLVAFLNARLDEDEAVARVAVRGGSGEWVVRGDGDLWDVGQDDFPDRIVVPDEGITTSTEFAHIARHDPARVLREVAAKRAIVELVPYDTREDVVRQLAAVYSDHPDYRHEWALGDR